GNRDALARCGVGASPHIDTDGRMVGVGVLFALEGADVPLAVLVAVVDDPGFLRLAPRRNPLALPDRHAVLPAAIGSMSQYVAIAPIVNRKAVNAFLRPGSYPGLV